MNILVTDTDDINEFMESDTFKKFNDGVRDYINKVQEEHLNSLSNDIQKKIFTDWCNGICVCSEEYITQNNISKEDDYEAHSAIMSVISMGLG